jgi:tetratricopeptide (TPR) repeat protein
MNREQNSIPSESTLLRTADAQLQAGHYEEARVAVQQVLRRDPRNVRAWVIKGESLRREKQPHAALEAFEQARNLDPHDDWVLARLSETHRDLGNFPQALLHLNKALDLNPESVFALAVKGEILRSMGHYAQAVEYLDRALELNLQRATEAAHHAELLRTNRRYEESLRAFEQAVTHYTNSGWVLAAKAESLHAQGEWNAALDTTDMALETRQRHLDLLSEKAEMLRRVGQFDSALACYDEAQSLLQHGGRLVGTRAMILTDLRLYEEADLNFQEAIELSPGVSLWWLRRAALLQTLEQYDHARICLEQALALDPQNVESIATYVQLLCLTGAYSEARQFLSNGASLPNDDWFLFLQSIVEIYSDTPARGATLLNEALRRATNGWRQTNSREQRLRYLGNLALYYLVAQSEGRARELYQRFRREATPRQCMDALQDLEFARRCGLVKEGVEELVAYLS